MDHGAKMAEKRLKEGVKNSIYVWEKNKKFLKKTLSKKCQSVTLAY